jgi:hypothetical protein
MPSKETHSTERSCQVRASALLALASAFITAALPFAVYVRETFAKHREIEVAKAEQAFKERSAYLDRAIDPARPAALRQQVLRFLVQTSDDDRLRKWADDEQKRVDSEVEALKTLAAQQKEQIDQKDKEIAKAKAAFAQAHMQDKKALADTREKLELLELAKQKLEGEYAQAAQRLKGAGTTAPPHSAGMLETVAFPGSVFCLPASVRPHGVCDYGPVSRLVWDVSFGKWVATWVSNAASCECDLTPQGLDLLCSIRAK